MRLKDMLLRAPLISSLLVSLVVGGALIGIRQRGWFEPLELMSYDWMLNRQPRSPVSSARVTIVGITEEDIRRQGHWPLTDEDLARTLQILIQYQPCAIGVDLFRDMPVPPGEPELEKVLTENPNIIVVTKAGGPTDHGVPPLPYLQETEQFGFADVVLDPGSIVRRGLLYLHEGKKPVVSFSLRLALIYLQREGIVPQLGLVDPQDLRLGHVTFKPFEGNDGGYIDADARGYQFLLDFQDAGRPYPSFTLTSVLNEEVAPKAMRDRIVLLGMTADSVRDTFLIPYGETLGSVSTIPGVQLHAQMVTQLLRGALDGGGQITTMSEPQEWGWILLWCVAGGRVGLLSMLPWQFLLSLIGGISILGALVHGAFLQRWWIPLIPPAVGWVLSANLVRTFFLQRKDTV